MTNNLVTIKHHSGIKLAVEGPAGVGIAMVTVRLDDALRIDLPLNEAELLDLRKGLDKALAQIARGW